MLLLLTKSKKFSIACISLLFLPGTVLHELSHLITAEILRVKTHGMEFTPEYDNDRLKMGSVMIQKTDFFRQFLIGVAPLVVGSSVLVLSLFFLSSSFSYTDIFGSFFNFAVTLGIALIIFIITNTMFSSKKDMDGALELLIVLLVVFVILFFAGLNPQEYILSFMESTANVVQVISMLLVVPLCINVFISIVFYPLIKRKFVS